MRGSRRPSRSGCDQGPGSDPITTGMRPRIQGQSSATATAQHPVQRPSSEGPARVERGSSEGRARVERGASIGQVSGLCWADRGLKERIGSQGRRHLLGVDRTVEGGKDPTAPATANGIPPPRDLRVFHPTVNVNAL